MKNYGQYLKAIVGVIGAGLAGLQQAFPGAHWVSVVTLALVPVLVYLVPNAPAPPAVPAPPEKLFLPGADPDVLARKVAAALENARTDTQPSPVPPAPGEPPRM